MVSFCGRKIMSCPPCYRWFILTGLLLFVTASRMFPVRSDVDIIVTGADATKKVDVIPSSTLNGLLIFFSARVAFNYNDAAQQIPLMALPDVVKTLLGQVSKRVAFEYADANAALSLSLPKALINDTTPPQILIEPKMEGVVLNWTSNEFTKATVQFGTSPGNYTSTISETEFTKDHRITLLGVVAGTRYYIKITQVDLSDNSANNPESLVTITDKKFVFLPLIRH
jgi:hypothetical protein